MSSLTLSPGAVLALVGDQLDVVEAVVRAVEALAADHEDIAALDGVPLAVGQLDDSRYWPGLGRLHLLAGLAFDVGVQLPGLDGLLDRLVLVVVADLEEGQLALALDRLAVQGLGVEEALMVSPAR